MPGLVAFKRRWETGSDDLVIPSFMMGMIHLILFIVIAVHLMTSSDLQRAEFNVEEMEMLNANASDIIKATCAIEIRDFSFGYLGLLITAVLIEIVIVGFSMQGTIMNPQPRKPLQYVIYVRLVLGLVEVAYTIFVAVKLTQTWKACESLRELYDVHAAIVGVNAVVIFIVILTAFCTFDSSGGSFYRFEKAVNERSSSTNINHMRSELNQKRQQFWKGAFAKCFCCRLGSSNAKAALDDVARIFGDFFRNQDLVPSDIVAGFILLRHKQQRSQEEIQKSDDNPIKEYMCGRPITENTIFMDHSNQTEAHEFSVMTYYCQYAVASYGPLMYMYSHMACGVCYLMEECMCGADRTSCCPATSNHHRPFASATIRKDTCCEWRTSAIRKTMLENGLRGDVDLVYVSWNNDLYKQPFFVAVDHKMKSIVVTIRGTLSDIDALTDIVATPMQIPECDSSWKAHKGIVQGAIYIRQQLLEEEMILSQAFGRDLSRGTRDYQLVIVGHSLGAGVAVILSISLKRRYPHLICYAYSPPGGLLSLAAMEGSKHYINTAVLGKDMITRTGIVQLERLRNEITSLLKATSLPKYRVILGNLVHTTQSRHKLLQHAVPMEEERNLVDHPGDNLTESCSDTSCSEDLYPPGKIIHIVYRKPTKDQNFCSKPSERNKYFAIESDNRNDFNELLISHKMVVHHFPNELLKAMKKVIKQSQIVADSRKYTESETLPVGGLTRNGKSRRSDLAEKPKEPVIEQPPAANIDHGFENIPLHQSPEQRATVPENIGDEPVVAPLARMDSFSESGSMLPTGFGVESPAAGSSLLVPSKSVDVIVEVDEQEANHNINNSNATGIDSPQVQETLPVGHNDRPAHSQSMVHHFGDYMDVVLTEPQSFSQNETAATSESRYSRSLSMPARPPVISAEPYSLDRNVVRRAQFEPNLIPKPPRTHSIKKTSRPDELPLSREYGSAPSSRITTPMTPSSPKSSEIKQ
uniref:sn-1-specific diacylglycerol lipase n=1 Tax=Phallusia mammillata TaxID=59560 RepID=A0A6F9D9X7_9ASCI|nr:sn1-specific diacylglycerol lipase alpha [Phallusia mammillata]